MRATLTDRGFSQPQFKKLQEAFGHLDALALQNLPLDQLLPVMTGHTVAEKMQQVTLFQAAVQEVQSCLSALSRAKT